MAADRQETYRQMIYQERLAICYKCPYIRKIAGFPNCQICKCFVQAKTFLLNQRCPKGYW